MGRERSIRIRILTLGFCAVCAQALFVREILGVLAGTELVLGLVLAAWLFWTAAGGIFGGRLHRHGPERAGRLFDFFAGLAAALVPATVLAIRFVRGISAWPTGGLPPFGPAVAFSIVSSAPFAFVYGILYNFASVASARTGGIQRGITTVYALEAAGSAAGAVLFSFCLAAFFTQVEAAALILLVVGAVFAATARAHRALPLAIVAAAAVLAAVWLPALDRATMARVLRGYTIERILPSKHGELYVARDRETLSIFSGTSRVATLPPTGELEETVHVPLLAHPAPRTMLLIGGAVGGGVYEASRHPGVERIDWVELDPALAALAADIEAAGAHDDGEAEGDERPRVRALTGDGRFMLARTEEKYDVIVVATPAPVTLRWNRFYTEEFFRLAGAALSPRGVFAISHLSSENYLSAELAEVLAMVKRSLGTEFPFVAAIPGHYVQFLASREPLRVEDIPQRLRSRRLDTRYVHEEQLLFRIMSERLEHFELGLERARYGATNTDSRPVLVILELALEGTRTGAGGAMAGALVSVPPAVPPGAAAALLGLVFLLARGQRASARAGVFTVGMCSMLLQVKTMLAFQSFSGLLHHAFVVMTALFMAGAAVGAARKARGRAPAARRLRVIHAGFVLLAAAVPLWLRATSSGIAGPVAAAAGFMLVPAAAGFLTGEYYRIVVHAAYGRCAGEAPAVFYAYDLLGAVAGGLIAGLIMIPVAGTFGTAAFIAMAHLSAAVLIAKRAAQ